MATIYMLLLFLTSFFTMSSFYSGYVNVHFLCGGHMLTLIMSELLVYTYIFFQ